MKRLNYRFGIIGLNTNFSKQKAHTEIHLYAPT